MVVAGHAVDDGARGGGVRDCAGFGVVGVGEDGFFSGCVEGFAVAGEGEAMVQLKL